MPRINLILARARNGTIGRGNEIPWQIAGELAYFKRTTMGHPVIMGRKTWESIAARTGGALPGRRNIVVSRNANQVAPGAEVAASLDAAFNLAGEVSEVFVLGGAEVFALALPRATRAFVTEIDRDYDGDAVMPALDSAQWHETQRRAGATDRGQPPHAFVIYERRG